ncbi:glycosyltransferase [Hymenobacter persicinus]|uniref:Glycosyltransferase n=1 Tax=Hymenobacter persicinus TaxID=2025506 RepID=A0A4Q5LD49_9BACT|nr:glycosyltransferase [Hymenobacter persicinus]RYU79425.1 glycosyltransferase [Hymenobacter persicinus]
MKSSSTASPLRIAFISSCDGDWGGSEELWAGTALALAQAGHHVQGFKTNVTSHPRLQALRAAGCPVTELAPAVPVRYRIANRLLPVSRQFTSQKMGFDLLRQHLRAFRPDVVLVSQGSNYDGCAFANLCRQEGLAYALLSQKAPHSTAPHAHERTVAQQVFQAARRAFFVSRHNLELTQLQLGVALPAAEVVWNPYNVAFQGELPWPAATDGALRLACVARLFLSDKGQDILLQVLAQDKWRQRKLHLTLYGAGPDEEIIRGMISFLGLENTVCLGGHVADVAQVWSTHHALILPSRYEGLPLALVEAMLSGRPTIASDAGGIIELLVDNETGFVASGITFLALDEALERSWAKRASWAQMGAEAARQARAVVPADTLELLAHKLLQIVHEERAAAGPGVA